MQAQKIWITVKKRRHQLFTFLSVIGFQYICCLLFFAWSEFIDTFFLDNSFSLFFWNGAAAVTPFTHFLFSLSADSLFSPSLSFSKDQRKKIKMGITNTASCHAFPFSLHQKHKCATLYYRWSPTDFGYAFWIIKAFQLGKHSITENTESKLDF